MSDTAYKYWAFISYSHRDQAWAQWLHRSIETYRVPRRLVGLPGPDGPLPRRLFPLFRDIDELPSSPNLGSAIDQALTASRYLIVICSPYAASSRWVDQEIARFRALGRGERILCLIVDGEPNADSATLQGQPECFPPSLRGDIGLEPIAADVRPGKENKASARLKLIAGLLQVGLDELRRRERRRQFIQRVVWTLASLALIAVFTGGWQMQRQAHQEALARQMLNAHIKTVYEKGRGKLLAHDQARAAVYLNEAYRLGVDTPALRFMLARAMRIVDNERLAFQTGGPVAQLDLSPDGRLLLTADSNHHAQIWQVADGKKVAEFDGLPAKFLGSVIGPIFSLAANRILLKVTGDNAGSGLMRVWDSESGHLLVERPIRNDVAASFNAFEPAGNRFAYVAPDGAAEIYDLASTKVVRRIGGPFKLAGYSRDGRFIVTGDAQGRVALWDASVERRPRLLLGLTSSVYRVDDTADGALVAASAADGGVRVWERSTGAVRLTAGHPTRASMVFNIDGHRLLTGANDGYRVWNTVNGSLVYARQGIGAGQGRTDISSGGTLLATNNDGRLAVLDARNGAELFTLDGHQGGVEALDFSEDDRELATGGPDGNVVIWRLPALADASLDHAVDPLRWGSARRSPGVAAVYSHAGKLIATGAGDGLLKLWDAGDHHLNRSIAADSRSVNVLAFSADDARVATGGEAEGVKIWDVASGRLLRTLGCDGKRVLTLAFGNDGRTVAAAVIGGTTRIWDSNSGEPLARFDRDNAEAAAGAYSPDGQRFAIGIRGSVKLWDIASSRFLWSTTLEDGAGQPSEDAGPIAFSGDGSQLLAANVQQAVFLLDAADGRIRKRLLEPSLGTIYSLRFSARGEQGLLSDENRTAVVWRFDDDRLLTLHGHTGPVLSADFAPDDRLILTSSSDGTARVWDAASGEELDTVSVHAEQMPDAPFQAAQFGPAGTSVLSGSIDGEIRLDVIGEELRTPAQLAAILRCHVPWQLAGDDLAPTSRNGDACAPR